MTAARNNPFRVQRMDVLPYRLEGYTWPQLLTRLESLNFRGAIVGPHGHGKTTLLDSLAPHVEARGLVVWRLNLNTSRRSLVAADWQRLESLDANDCIFLDGAEQLNWWSWHRLLRETRKAGGLVITSHSSGLLPTLMECHTSAQLLRDLMEELHPEGVNFDEIAAVLFKKHGGNLRFALRELYDRYAISA